MSRSSVKQKEREAAIKRRQKKAEKTSKVTAPVSQVKKIQRNKKAEAILRRLQRDAKKPERVPPLYNKGTVTREKVMKAAGIESSAMRKPIQNAPVDGARRHDLMFMTNSDDPFKPRVNISKGAATLRRANIKNQQGQLLDEMKPMDVVTAEPHGSEKGSKFNARAKIYERLTKGALKSRIDPKTGEAKIGSLKTVKDTWINEAKVEKRFDPKTLKKDLTKMAAGKIAARLGGPVMQGLVTAEDLTKQAFGVGLFENSSKKTQEVMKKAQDYILKRLGLK